MQISCIKGKGVIDVESKGSNFKLIYDVHYVPSLVANLKGIKDYVLRQN